MKISTAMGEYEKLSGERSGFLSRGQEFSKVTLPYVLPVGSGGTTAHGYQGIGAEAVNYLANKVANAIAPTTSSFFRLDLGEEAERELAEQGYDKSELMNQFIQIENTAMRKYARLHSRPKMVSLAKNLIITGNGCLVTNLENDSLTVLNLNNYVVKRDVAGNLITIITKQEIDFVALPPEVQEALKGKYEEDSDLENLPLFDMYNLNTDGTWKHEQSVDDFSTHEAEFKKEELPVIVARWNSNPGEDYGRGLVEDHRNDFHVISFLSEARAKGAATMMDVKYLVRPGSLTDVGTLNSSPTGTFVQGIEDDISVLQLDKYADHNLINSVMEEYTQRIGRAFTMASTTRRDSERTTATEVRMDATELDESLGGMYSSLAAEVQVPLAYLLLGQIDEDLVGENFEPIVTTGLDALGRAEDLEKLYQFSELMALPLGWAEPLQQRIKWQEYVDMVSGSLALEINFLMTDEEFEAQQQEQMSQRVAELGSGGFQAQLGQESASIVAGALAQQQQG